MLINIYTIFIQLINIGILYLILKKLLFKPLEDFLEQRKKKIQNQLKEAERQRKEANILHTEYTSRLENAREEIRTLLKTAENEAEKLRKQRVEQANREADSLITRATEEIEKAKKKATKELLDKTADISLLATARILEDHLLPEHHREIIHKIAERIGDGKWAQ